MRLSYDCLAVPTPQHLGAEELHPQTTTETRSTLDIAMPMGFAAITGIFATLRTAHSDLTSLPDHHIFAVKVGAFELFLKLIEVIIFFVQIVSISITVSSC